MYPHDVRDLFYYRSMAPWQTQWAGIRDGQSLLVQDDAGETVGYALYKRGFDHSGTLTSIFLMQCEVNPEREDSEAIIRYTLSNVFGPFEVAFAEKIQDKSKREAIQKALDIRGYHYQ